MKQKRKEKKKKGEKEKMERGKNQLILPIHVQKKKNAHGLPRI